MSSAEGLKFIFPIENYYTDFNNMSNIFGRYSPDVTKVTIENSPMDNNGYIFSFSPSPFNNRILQFFFKEDDSYNPINHILIRTKYSL